MLGFCGAFLFCALLVTQPALCRQWAGEALADWALAVAPSLLPFLLALPYLTGPEARGVYQDMLGWLARPFGLPSEAAGAMAVGMLAGSPAGAAATRQLGGRLTHGQALRLSVLSSGAGPAFYLSYVGTLLSDLPAARLLCLCQWASAALAALLLRVCVRSTEPVPIIATDSPRESSVYRAVGQILTIGGCMVFFAIVGEALTLYLGEGFRAPVMALLELSRGARAVSVLSGPWRLPLLGAACCFGGASVCAQSLTQLRPLGIRPVEYVCAKLIHAVLDAGLLLAAPLVHNLFSFGG